MLGTPFTQKRSLTPSGTPPSGASMAPVVYSASVTQR